jgi:glycine dehydrogenase
VNVITGFAGTAFATHSGHRRIHLMTSCIPPLRGDQKNNLFNPPSAHGTNPASAAMAGMTIIVTKHGKW